MLPSQVGHDLPLVNVRFQAAADSDGRDRLRMQPQLEPGASFDHEGVIPMQRPDASLLSQLQSLEVELHQPEVRGDAARLDALLHDDFQEFGRSGATYAKSDIVAQLPTATQHAHLVADNFIVRSLAVDVALLTYRSAQALPDGTLHRHTLRSSIWQRCDVGWRMRFHQGTPTEPYEPR